MLLVASIAHLLLARGRCPLVGIAHTHKLSQLDRNYARTFPPLKLTHPLAVWQGKPKLGDLWLSASPVWRAIPSRSGRIFLQPTKKSPLLALDYILTLSQKPNNCIQVFDIICFYKILKGKKKCLHIKLIMKLV